MNGVRLFVESLRMIPRLLSSSVPSSASASARSSAAAAVSSRSTQAQCGKQASSSSVFHHPFSSCAAARPSTRRSTAVQSIVQHRRLLSDQMIFRTRDGRIKVNLASKNMVGVSQSRGERPYQEDTYSVQSVLIPTQALKRNVSEIKGAAGVTSDLPEGYPDEDLSVGAERKKQVAFFGVYDGHGGSFVSHYLRDHLPSLLESANSDSIPAAIKTQRAHGGYLRRYRGGPLERFREPKEEGHQGPRGMSLDEMLALSYVQSDNNVLADPASGKSGSVGTTVLLHSLDTPHSLPYYASSLVSLTIAHLGDTRAILASTSTGRATPLTENHHPDSRVESERLRQSGTGIVTDSFGESRWGGTLANTRGVGDREFKTLGVIAEPEVSKRVLIGAEWAFVVLLSDGVSDVMSDQEIVDLCRGIADPTRAANKIVSFAEDVGATDNCTVIVIPLGGWRKMGGVDTTASRREFRLRQSAGQSSRQARM